MLLVCGGGAIDCLGGGESIENMRLRLYILLLFPAVTIAYGSAVPFLNGFPESS